MKLFDTKIGRGLVLGSFAALLLFAGFNTSSAAGVSGGNTFGFAWGGTSSTDNAYRGIGWISFNSMSDGSAATYGVTIPSADGDISGNAWSEHYGWLSFNAADLAGCPSGLCKAYRQGNTIGGWARFLSIRDAGVNRGGWRGWIGWREWSGGGGWSGWVSLSGTAANGSPYGVRTSGTNFPGYAWSSELGWIDFSALSTLCPNRAVNPPACDVFPPTATLLARPTTIDSGQFSTLTWTSEFATSCTAAGGFSTDGAALGSASTGPLTSTQNYQVICTGPGGSANSNVATVTVLVPTVTISAAPSRVVSGGTVTVSWGATNVNACNITKNGATWRTLTATPPSRALSGSSPDTITTQTTYTIVCTNNASATTATQIVNVVTKFREF